jgi:hypothetical protein
MAGINRRQMMVGGGAAAGLSALSLGADLRGVLAQAPRGDDAAFGGGTSSLDAGAPPPTIAGATVATKGWYDAIGYDGDGTVSTLTHVFDSGLNSVFSAGGGVVLCALEVPHGATLQRVDMYGFRGTSGTQSWALLSYDVTIADVSSVQSAVSPTGTGAVQTTLSSLSLTPPVGTIYVVDLLNTSATNAFAGVVYQYTNPRKSFVPVGPFRAYDSRWSGAGGLLGANQSRTVTIKDAYSTAGVLTTPDVVPSGAAAIAYNLTITGTGGGGFLAVTNGDAAGYTASAINWSAAGLDLANGGNSPVNASRQIKVWGGFTGSTHFLIDVTGYYI